MRQGAGNLRLSHADFQDLNQKENPTPPCPSNKTIRGHSLCNSQLCTSQLCTAWQRENGKYL